MQDLGFEDVDGDGFDFDDVVHALKEALSECIEWVVKKVSKKGGYLDNKLIRIPWPEDLASVKRKLMRTPVKGKVREFIKRINRAAELAAPASLDIIVDAVMSLNFERLNDILHTEGGATQFLREQTFGRLERVFMPIIDEALEAETVTSVFDDLLDFYNDLPFISDVEIDLPEYCTSKALEGLFVLLEQREDELRESPMMAKTEDVAKLFSNIDDLFFSSSSDEDDYSQDYSQEDDYDDDESYGYDSSS